MGHIGEPWNRSYGQIHKCLIYGPHCTFSSSFLPGNPTGVSLFRRWWVGLLFRFEESYFYIEHYLCGLFQPGAHSEICRLSEQNGILQKLDELGGFIRRCALFRDIKPDLMRREISRPDVQICNCAGDKVVSNTKVSKVLWGQEKGKWYDEERPRFCCCRISISWFLFSGIWHIAYENGSKPLKFHALPRSRAKHEVPQHPQAENSGKNVQLLLRQIGKEMVFVDWGP